MKKKNLWMLMLVIGLVWAMMACDTDDGDTLKPENAGYWYGTYESSNTGTGKREKITFSDDRFCINEFDEGQTEATNTNIIDITLTKWEKADTHPSYNNDYPYAFKFTGILKELKGYAEDIGPDVMGNAGVVFYLYFNEQNNMLWTKINLSEGSSNKNPVIDAENNPRVYTQQK